MVTAFVVQSSQALKPDYAQISVSLLAEMMALQRAWASGSSIDDVPRSSLALDAVTASALDYWCNGLWYTSLALSMSAALMAVLIKQWLLVSEVQPGLRPNIDIRVRPIEAMYPGRPSTRRSHVNSG